MPLHDKSAKKVSIAFRVFPAPMYLVFSAIILGLFFADEWGNVAIVHRVALPALWMEIAQYYRLFTYQFVHDGWVHLLSNLFVLIFLGARVERKIGSLLFLVLFLGSGVLGGIVWAVTASPTQYCLGASASVAGLLGGWAVLYPDARLRFSRLFFPRFTVPILWMIALWLVLELAQLIYPFFGPVANTAHIAAFIFGELVAYGIKWGTREVS